MPAGIPYSTPPDFYGLRHCQEKLERHRRAVQQDLDELNRFIADHPHTAQWLQEKNGQKLRPTLVVDNINTRQRESEQGQAVKRYRPTEPPERATPPRKPSAR
jgi:hypothetical protein